MTADRHILVNGATGDDRVVWSIECPTTRCGWQECRDGNLTVAFRGDWLSGAHAALEAAWEVRHG